MIGDHVEKSIVNLQKQSIISMGLMVIGFCFIFFSIYFSAIKLGPLERNIKSKEKEINTLSIQIKSLNDELSKTITDRNKAIQDLTEIRLKKIAAQRSLFFMQLGLRYFFVKNYNQAIINYKSAIQIDRENPVLYDLLGYAYLRNGDVQNSILALETSVKINPEYTWGHYNLALAYGRVNDDRAIIHIKELLKLDPSIKSVIKNDGQFRIFKYDNEFQKLIK